MHGEQCSRRASSTGATRAALVSGLLSRRHRLYPRAQRMASRRASSEATADAVQAAIRQGVVRFVTRFATRHRVEGLPIGEAARAAVGDMAQRAIQGLIENSPFAPGAIYPPSPARTPPKNRKRPSPVSSVSRKGPRKPDPDLLRLEKLKRYVAGEGAPPGPDPGPETQPRRRSHGR